MEFNRNTHFIMIQHNDIQQKDNNSKEILKSNTMISKKKDFQIFIYHFFHLVEFVG